MRFAVAPRNVERVEKIGFAPFNRCPKIKRGNKAGIVPRHAHRPILGSSAISRSIDSLVMSVLPPSFRASSPT